MQAGEGEGEKDSMMRPSTTTAFSTRRGLAGNAGGRRSRLMILLGVGIIAICIFAVPLMTRPGPGLRGSSFPVVADKWNILLISDLDKLSKVDDKGKQFRSVLQAGTLSRDPDSGSYRAEFGEHTDLFSGHNEAGRGMELSELLNYQGSLLTVDDRTGIVFEIVDDGEENEVTSRHMAPRYILPEGDGLVDKGMKLEWATVKHGSLVLGSMGKEYTDSDGRVVNTNNNWVIFIDENGVISREDWTQYYTKLREAADAVFPGYMIHESAAWSDKMKKWVFCPRRISSEQYDDMKDENMGSNTILIADENFRHVDVKHAGNIIPTHGFSSFKFVPGTDDEVIVALKSMEETVEKDDGTSEQLQDTYIMVFNLDGEVLLEETEIPGELKFEGIEIMPIPAVDVESGGRR